MLENMLRSLSNQLSLTGCEYLPSINIFKGDGILFMFTFQNQIW